MVGTPAALEGAELCSPAERDRLVRMCARLCSPSVAEDLTQETLLEAWRSRGRLRDPEARPQWLAGIARNVCRRWQHRRGGAIEPPIHTLTFEDVEIHIADDTALDVALERSEVADLLDHALGLLPPGARDLLVERYVEDLPVGEMAARRGIAEGTTAVRLHRGKHALRRILSTDLREDAAALGLLDKSSEEWETTRIWCPFCGAAHLQARCEIAAGAFTVRCPICRHCITQRGAEYLTEVKGYWRTLLRANREANRYYREALAAGPGATCDCCGRPSRLQYSIPREITGLDRDVSGVHIRCDGCGAISMQPDLGLALTHPTVQQFWREHRHMRLAERCEIVSGGRDAILIRFESVATATAVEVVTAADTFEVLYAGGPGIGEVQE